MYQNKSQNLLKIWFFRSGFSFSDIILNTKKFFVDIDTAWKVVFPLRIYLVNVNNNKSGGTYQFFTFTKGVFKEKHRFLRSGIPNFYIIIALVSFSEFSVKKWIHK